MKKYLLNLNNSIVSINLFYKNLLYLVKDFLLERCNLYIGLLMLGSYDRTKYLGDEDTTFIEYIRDILEKRFASESMNV